MFYTQSRLIVDCFILSLQTNNIHDMNYLVQQGRICIFFNITENEIKICSYTHTIEHFHTIYSLYPKVPGMIFDSLIAKVANTILNLIYCIFLLHNTRVFHLFIFK